MRQLSAAPAIPADSLARSRAFAAAWAQHDGQRRLTTAFPADEGDPAILAASAVLLFRETAWLGALLAPLIAGLAADPWFEPPLRVHRDALRASVILFETANVRVTLSVLSAERLRELPAPASIGLSGRLGVTCYLRAGGATVQRWRAPRLPEPCVAAAMGTARRLADLRPADGAIVAQNGRSDAHVIAGAVCDVVTLAATIRPGADPVAREYDAVSGRFRRMATTDEGAARAQVLLSLLRAGSAGGTAASFDAATRDPAFFLRWSAMREWLAHDWRAAAGRLAEMAADDPHPEVRAAASATLATVLPRAA